MFFYPCVRMNASLTSSIDVISTFITILQLQARATSLDHLLYARYVKITFAQRFENTRQLRRVLLNWLVMN